MDGFRCDMAFLVPEDFWTPTIATLREEAGRPLFFLAEAEEDWMHRAGFDAMYAWRFHHLLNDIAQGRKGKTELVEEVQTFAQAEGRKRLCFTSNHDENSWAGTEFERMGEAWQAMSVLCWTLPNSLPLIYTGQEAGLSWRFKFFEKDEAPHWGNGEYAEFYRYLAGQRHIHPALDADAEFELLESGDDEIRYIRRKAGDEGFDEGGTHGINRSSQGALELEHIFRSRPHLPRGAYVLVDGNEDPSAAARTGRGHRRMDRQLRGCEGRARERSA